jgi:hypothetical protein
MHGGGFVALSVTTYSKLIVVERWTTRPGKFRILMILITAALTYDAYIDGLSLSVRRRV